MNPNMGKNPNCDGDHCRYVRGEVRKLPLGGGANAILCRTCWAHEMAFRIKRNMELSKDCWFDLPRWEDLEVYA